MNALKLALLLLSVSVPGISAEGQGPADVAQEMLAILQTRDADRARQLILPDAYFYAHRLNEQDEAQIAATSSADYLSGLAAGGPLLLERMWDEETFVDGALATVRGTYDFYIGEDRRFSHCGTNVFSLLRTAEGWKIAAITYNVQRDCPESPLGPPARAETSD